MTSNNVEMNAVADSHVKTVNSEKKEKCFRSCSNAIIHGLERAFGKLGGLIARNTVITIVVSLGICLLFLIGLIETYEENRPEKLWVSSESDSLVHSAWFSANYPPEIRICHIIVQNDNLLTPAGLDMLCTLHEGVLKISKNDSKTPNLNWKTKCFSPANNGICLPPTILNVWNSNCTHIRKLNQQQILTDVNAAATNPMLVSKLGKINLLIGGLTEDNNKKIEKAAAARMTYFLKNEEVYQKDQGRRVDVRGNVWEEEFVSFVKNKSSSYSGSEISYYSLTSQRSDSGDAVGGDLILLALGYVLIIVYLAVMLGSFSRVSHKVWLAICGVVVIGLSFGVSYGLSSAFQLMISPVHNVLPFLLLGIGVDDVFVIIRTWGNINNKVGKDTPTVEKITLMMQHAGVSILVTSFTDVCAFLIGATTVLPALRSFCVYAGIGIIAVFILTCTFFVAWLTLDSRREKAYRDACCCCIQYNSTEWSPMECADKDYLQLFMKNVYSRIILSLPGRITVLIVFAGLIAGGAYGLSELKQDFDPDWFLPSDSMTIKFKIADEKYFPDGVKAAIFVGKVDYFAERNKLTSLYDKISKDKYVVDGSTISWYQSYSTWLKSTHNSWVYVSSPPSSPHKFLKIKAEYKVSFNYRTTANKNYFAIDPSGTRSPEEGLQIYFPANGSLVKVNIPITVNESYFVEFIQEKVGDDYKNLIRANNRILYTTINKNPGTRRTVLWNEKSDPLNAAVISDIALYYKKDDLPISMLTSKVFIKNGSRLERTCRIKSSNRGSLEFWDDDINVLLMDTKRRKISINTVSTDRGKYVVGNFVWDPIYVRDNVVRNIRCRNKESGESKTFGLVVVPDTSVPKVEIVNGSAIKLERKVKQHRLVCNVTVNSSDVVEDFAAIWFVGDLKPRKLPDGLSQKFDKEVNSSTGSVILTIKDSSVIDRKKLFCVSKLKFKESLEVVREFREETNVTVVGDFETKSNSIEVKTKAGEDATLDCKAVGKSALSKPIVKWWKKDEYVGTEVAIPADINSMNARYSHPPDKNPLSTNNSIISIKDVTYQDRSQFVCQAVFHDYIVNTTFTLRVADPFGPLWPVLGIIAEALVMVVIIWYTEFKRRQAEKKKELQAKEGKPIKDGDNAPLMKAHADGTNEVTA